MSKAFLTYRYITHKLRSRHSYGRGVNPPFAYSFIREIFYGEEMMETGIVEEIRKGMMADLRMVMASPRGVGLQTIIRWS